MNPRRLPHRHRGGPLRHVLLGDLPLLTGRIEQLLRGQRRARPVDLVKRLQLTHANPVRRIAESLRELGWRPTKGRKGGYWLAPPPPPPAAAPRELPRRLHRAYLRQTVLPALDLAAGWGLPTSPGSNRDSRRK